MSERRHTAFLLLEAADRLKRQSDQIHLLRLTLMSLHERLESCSNHPISAAEAYDSDYRGQVSDALAQTQPHSREGGEES